MVSADIGLVRNPSIPDCWHLNLKDSFVLAVSANILSSEWSMSEMDLISKLASNPSIIGMLQSIKISL